MSEHDQVFLAGVLVFGLFYGMGAFLLIGLLHDLYHWLRGREFEDE